MEPIASSPERNSRGDRKRPTQVFITIHDGRRDTVTILKLETDSHLPRPSLQHPIGSRFNIVDASFEANTPQPVDRPRPWAKASRHGRASDVVPTEKTDFGIKVGFNKKMVEIKAIPVTVVIELTQIATILTPSPRRLRTGYVSQ